MSSHIDPQVKHHALSQESDETVPQGVAVKRPVRRIHADAQERESENGEEEEADEDEGADPHQSDTWKRRR